MHTLFKLCVEGNPNSFVWSSVTLTRCTPTEGGERRGSIKGGSCSVKQPGFTLGALSAHDVLERVAYVAVGGRD
jgi:hypothetical protein